VTDFGDESTLPFPLTDGQSPAKRSAQNDPSRHFGEQGQKVTVYLGDASGPKCCY
jgi:hypothetical protein